MHISPIRLDLGTSCCLWLEILAREYHPERANFNPRCLLFIDFDMYGLVWDRHDRAQNINGLV